MFPTPPSADNPSSEPMQDADFMTDTAYLAMGSADPSGHQHLYSNSYHLVPKEEAVKHSATICAASIRKVFCAVCSHMCSVCYKEMINVGALLLSGFGTGTVRAPAVVGLH